MIKNRNTPGSRCSTEGNRIYTVFQRYHVHVTVLTMTHVKGDMGSTTGESTSVSEFINALFSRDPFNFQR
jgi:hypothetical protein